MILDKEMAEKHPHERPHWSEGTYTITRDSIECKQQCLDQKECVFAVYYVELDWPFRKNCERFHENWGLFIWYLEEETNLVYEKVPETRTYGISTVLKSFTCKSAHTSSCVVSTVTRKDLLHASIKPHSELPVWTACCRCNHKKHVH